MKSLFFLTLLGITLSAWQLKTRPFTESDNKVTPTTWKSGDLIDIYVHSPLLLGSQLSNEVILFEGCGNKSPFYPEYNVTIFKVPGVNNHIFGYVGKLKAGQPGTFNLTIQSLEGQLYPNAPPPQPVKTSQLITILPLLK